MKKVGKQKKQYEKGTVHNKTKWKQKETEGDYEAKIRKNEKITKKKENE